MKMERKNVIAKEFIVYVTENAPNASNVTQNPSIRHTVKENQF
ncbi:MAG: hypothetical protein N2Z65_00575 [Clostridiales bacterium]|nr:hypothetical protein [Clostridiales bacterium]